MKTEYCLGFAFANNSASVVLIRKTKPDWMAGKLNGVGGKIEPGESPAGAMSREYQEEAGVGIRPALWTQFATLDFEKKVVHCFAFEGFSATGSHSKTDETIGFYLWRGLEFTCQGCVPNLSWLVPMAHASLSDGYSKGPVVISYP